MEKNNFEEHSNINFVTVISLVLSAIGIFTSIYFYNKAKVVVDPFFMVDPLRTEILQKDKIGDLPIKVMKNNGTLIESDLSSLRFYIWNQGKASIKNNNILESLSLSFEDSSVNIIYPKILSQSRNIIGFKIFPDSTEPTKLLHFDFIILEEFDGITGQIIFEGNPNAILNISGTIEGAKSIKNELYFKSNFKKKLFTIFGVLYFIILIAVSYCLRVFFAILKNTNGKFKNHRLKVQNVKKVLWFFYIIFILGIGLQISKQANSLKSEFEKNIIQNVPESIMPL